MKILPITLSALMLLAGPALARDSAPQPAKALASSFFTGRWYEIARTDNFRQKDCQAPTYDFKPPKASAGPPAFVMTCRKGSPTGKAESMNINVRLPTDALRAKFGVSAMGGVLKQDYWILDRADDMSWAIMATPGGNYVWLLARKPTLDAGLKAKLIAQLSALGYDPAKIVLPRHV